MCLSLTNRSPPDKCMCKIQPFPDQIVQMSAGQIMDVMSDKRKKHKKYNIVLQQWIIVCYKT